MKRSEHGLKIPRRRDELVEVQNHRTLDRLGRLDRRAIGFDAHNLFPQRRLGGENLDRVVVALAHLRTIQTGNDSRFIPNARLREFKDLAKSFVHLHRNVAGHLEMLFLIPTDWHKVAVTNQNIGRHQHRISKQAMRGCQPPCSLVLERVTPLQ